jgi:hypothetical protein
MSNGFVHIRLRGPKAGYKPAAFIDSANGFDMLDHLERLFGRAVFQLWPNLLRDMQEQIFQAASSDLDIRRRVAVVLHDQHPKTAFPPPPSALA